MLSLEVLEYTHKVSFHSSCNMEKSIYTTGPSYPTGIPDDIGITRN
ncbi:MAG: hypothetical protein V4485_02660 [Pseudomonadota bacterium]